MSLQAQGCIVSDQISDFWKFVVPASAGLYRHKAIAALRYGGCPCKRRVVSNCPAASSSCRALSLQAQGCIVLRSPEPSAYCVVPASAGLYRACAWGGGRIHGCPCKRRVVSKGAHDGCSGHGLSLQAQGCIVFTMAATKAVVVVPASAGLYLWLSIMYLAV